MELFQDKGITAARIDEEQDREVLELSLDDLSYVAGGIIYMKYDMIGG